MSTPATRDNQSPLEAALLDVHATLSELLVAADEQYAAVADRDRARLEGVTRQQERLTARLQRLEGQRMAALGDASLETVVEGLPADEALRISIVKRSIARSVTELQQRNARSASLLERSAELAAQTLNFLQRLVTAQAPVYGARGLNVSQQSVLVDGRA